MTNLYQPLMEFIDIVVTRGGANTILSSWPWQNYMSLCHLVVKLVVETRLKMQLLCKKGYAEELQERDLTLDSLEEKSLTY